MTSLALLLLLAAPAPPDRPSPELVAAPRPDPDGDACAAANAEVNAELDRFPTLAQCDAVLAEYDRGAAYLQSRVVAAGSPSQREFWLDAQRVHREGRAAWQTLRSARWAMWCSPGTSPGPETWAWWRDDARNALLLLRKMIGDEDFARGRMP